jgi:hypothetical protein
MLIYRVYFEEEKRKAGGVPATNREHHPPVIHESAWRSISLSITYYRLCIYSSDSGVIRKWSQTLPTTDPPSQSTRLHAAQQPGSTTQALDASVQSSLPPQDIERMCKVFIRLLCSPEREIPYANQHPYTSTSHRRQRRRMRKDSTGHE